MTNVSVEIGHIYQDMELESNYLEVLKESLRIVEDKKFKHFSNKILIDDLNIKEKKWSVEELISFLKTHKFDIDFLFFESKFASLAEDFIDSLPKNKLITESFRKEKKQCLFLKDNGQKIKLKETYENDFVHYSCPLLSCLWQLCRVGICPFPEASFLSLKGDSPVLHSQTFTILEEKYETIEKQVLSLLTYRVCTSKINHYFLTTN